MILGVKIVLICLGIIVFFFSWFGYSQWARGRLRKPVQQQRQGLPRVNAAVTTQSQSQAQLQGNVATGSQEGGEGPPPRAETAEAKQKGQGPPLKHVRFNTNPVAGYASPDIPGSSNT